MLFAQMFTFREGSVRYLSVCPLSSNIHLVSNSVHGPGAFIRHFKTSSSTWQSIKHTGAESGTPPQFAIDSFFLSIISYVRGINKPKSTCLLHLLCPYLSNSFVFVLLPSSTPPSNTTFSLSLSTQRGKLSPIFRTNSASTRTPIRKQGTPEVLQFLPKGSSTQRATPVLHTCLLLFRGVTFLICLVFFVHVFQPPMFRVHVCSPDLGFRRES